MTAKAFLVCAAVLTLLLGVGWFLFPAAMLTDWGFAATPAVIFMSRRYAVLFLGNAVMLWSARAALDSPARRAILAGSLVGATIMAAVSLHGVLSGVIRINGLVAFGIELALAIGFGHFLLAKKA